jgi:hypothetical protein
MTEMALRNRIAVLVVTALLAVAGAFGTSAFLAADEADAMSSYPICWKDVYGVWHCHG